MRLLPYPEILRAKKPQRSRIISLLLAHLVRIFTLGKEGELSQPLGRKRF